MTTASFTTPQSSQIKEIFTQITPRYDFLNGLLSLRLDRAWRKWAVRRAVDGTEKSLLDIGTGTGKFLSLFLERPHFERVYALDLCESMLEKAKARIRDPRVTWLNADVSAGIPLQDGSFDLISAAFTLRSIKDLRSFFAEVRRILRPGGKIAFLELTRPSRGLLKLLYYPYLKFYLPAVGSLFSRSATAYSFLSDSVLHFDEPAKLKKMLEETGFSAVSASSYSGGIATLLMGTKNGL